MTTRAFCILAAGLAAALAPALAAPPAVPAPAAEIGQLAFFAGDWTCTGNAEDSPLGPHHPTSAKVHVGKEFGGFWYVGRYAEAKAQDNPQPMTFLFLMGFDPAAKVLTLDGFDTFGNRSHQTASGWQDAALVFVGESHGDTALPARDTFTRKGDNTLEHFAELQLDGKWVRLDRETCTKGK